MPSSGPDGPAFAFDPSALVPGLTRSSQDRRGARTGEGSQ
ncbi:hypothetical protein ACVWXU_001479 [Streptomyces sp. TE33382]